ncbi:MAG: ATP-binding cassette domain-containing protein [Gemmatimonadetes bacterium]|nr:ATP-binding cassette domain-containing protein [Gemmatimonadota bacterium]
MNAYAPFARLMDPDQPVYGVQDTAEDLSRPVAQIAAEHVRALREARPHGPYHVAGWSFGGFVAYEMASILERQGERVGMVCVVDAMAPELARQRFGYDYTELLVGMATDVAEHAGRPFAFDHHLLYGLHPDEQARRVVQALHEQGAAPRGYDGAALREACQVLLDRTESLSGYVPGPFSGTVTRVRARDVPRDYAAFCEGRDEEVKHTLGWNAVSAAPVEVHDEALKGALWDAGGADLFGALPAGLDTVLSREYQGGADLSGGQWQRVALARALTAVRGGAGLLILDEPTAALDVRAETELRVFGLQREILARFQRAWRESRAYLLAAGRRGALLDMAGDLLGRAGLYPELYLLQARSYA